MKINENIVKITGSVNLPSELTIDTEYVIQAKTDCDKIDTKSNQDGTVNLIYKLRLSGDMQILDSKLKQLMKSKESKTMSQKLRGRIYAFQDEKGIVMPDDEFYEMMMKKIIIYFDIVAEFLKNKT
jgi:hypothetical protein